MIGLVIFIEIMIFLGIIVFFYIAEEHGSFVAGIIALILRTSHFCTSDNGWKFTWIY